MGNELEYREKRKPITKYPEKKDGDKKVKKNKRFKLPLPKLSWKNVPEYTGDYFHNYRMMTSTRKRIAQEECREKGEHTWAYHYYDTLDFHWIVCQNCLTFGNIDSNDNK